MMGGKELCYRTLVQGHAVLVAVSREQKGNHDARYGNPPKENYSTGTTEMVKHSHCNSRYSTNRNKSTSLVAGCPTHNVRQ